VFIISVLLVVVVAGCGRSVDSLDVVTPQGLEISNFFMVTLVIGLLVCVLVAGVLAVAVARFRGGRYPVGEEPPQVTGNRRLEITWTLIPLLTVLVLFLISLRIMNVVHANDSPSAGGLPIQVIGQQFWWEYRYPAPSNPSTQVITANELHIPVGQIVRLQVASNDVLHDFWVPQLGWKRDAVPGKTNTMSMTVLRAGTYDGECTNLCGIAHAWMRIRVIAESELQFQSWLTAQAQPGDPPATPQQQHGQRVFLANTCTSCHTVAGTTAQAQVGPNLTHFGSRFYLASGVQVNDPQHLRAWLENPQAVKRGVLMPGYASLGNDDLDALVAYLEALK